MISKRIIIIVILLNLCTVSAADFQEYDFDGNFKMSVPDNSTFEKTGSFLGLDIYQSNVFHDFKNDINVSCIPADEKYLDDMIGTIEKEPDVNLTQKMAYT